MIDYYFTITTLTNGLRVCNFSSPHDFKFEDGSILKACDNIRADKLKVNFNETKHVNYNNVNIKPIYDIELTFSLSDILFDEIVNVLSNYENKFDICIIPLSMLNAIKNDYRFRKLNISHTPFRVIRIKDRIKKLVSISEFCI